jgi:WD40 repeat protein
VRFSPDERRVLTCSEDFNATLWDVATGQPIFVPGAQRSGPRRGIQQSGRWIVTASTDGTARIWDAETGEPLLHRGRMPPK